MIGTHIVMLNVAPPVWDGIRADLAMGPTSVRAILRKSSAAVRGGGTGSMPQAATGGRISRPTIPSTILDFAVRAT